MTHTRPPSHRIPRRLAAAGLPALAACVCLGAAAAEVEFDLQAHVRSMAQAHHQQLSAAAGQPAPRPTRIEVDVGALDSRVRLAPCARMEPYLPPGMQAWGRTRIGVRCLEGPTRWNVFLPVTVRVFGPVVVAVSPLPAGTELQPSLLTTREADWAAERSPVVTDPVELDGRVLARALHADQPLRESHLRPIQWFASGDTVRVIARGRGFAVSSQGRAPTPGVAGRTARVRTDNGRIVTGVARAEGVLEVNL
jgi:flagellar basal body P-ring formation protein FlgA